MTKIIDTITKSKSIKQMHIEFLMAIQELKEKVIESAKKQYDENKYKFATYASWERVKGKIKVEMELNVLEVEK